MEIPCTSRKKESFNFTRRKSLAAVEIRRYATAGIRHIDNTLGNEAKDWILSSDLEINTFKGPDIALLKRTRK